MNSANIIVIIYFDGSIIRIAQESMIFIYDELIYFIIDKIMSFMELNIGLFQCNFTTFDRSTTNFSRRINK